MNGCCPAATGPLAPSSGLAALNLGSLSVSSSAQNPPSALAPTQMAQGPTLSGALGSAVALDLSLPSERKVAPSPWAKNRVATAATPQRPEGQGAPVGGAASARSASGIVPPAFAWTAECNACPPGHSNGLTASGILPGSPAQRGVGLRALVLPRDLNAAFLRVASSNTLRNVETCGILAGSIVKGELRCDRVLVPSQTGTSDTCTTTNEDEIWEYCSGKGLATFGWVHTHPSQSCFLSSVDLHTQCGYQSMIDEAVAIVLSPSHTPSEGCFRLCHPSPPGLREVQRCRKTGFHPDHQRNGQHPGNGVYEESRHVRWDPAVSVQVVDMRR